MGVFPWDYSLLSARGIFGVEVGPGLKPVFGGQKKMSRGAAVDIKGGCVCPVNVILPWRCYGRVAPMRESVGAFYGKLPCSK